MSKNSLQCNIAHALEKTKYPDSDIYWKKFDEKYHFSCQFTADIIAMNNADFIITSTYQEIAGRFFLFWLIDNTILYLLFQHWLTGLPAWGNIILVYRC
jgi:hypothetical protein